ncbi:tyrosine-type recombinase/integrase [Chloroflexota bacterium]
MPACQRGVPAFPQSSTGLLPLLRDYRLYSDAEGKSPKTIETVAGSVKMLWQFLADAGLPTSADSIGPDELRAFILDLKRRPCFSNHPYARPQERSLSPHSVNTYLRSIRAFWSWLEEEDIIATNPFDRVKVPKAPRKVVATFSEAQIRDLLTVIDTSTAEGRRDYLIIVLFLDTAMRLSELSGLTLDDLKLDDGIVKVMGKGSKERLIPVGRFTRRILWRYLNQTRPRPLNPRCTSLFLTSEGLPMTGHHIRNRIVLYGKTAGIRGVRCSPHTLRHTAAVSFLRNGGDVFSLQRLLGHTSLNMTRHYCELADIDVQRAHATASPVDNLMLPGVSGNRGQRKK